MKLKHALSVPAVLLAALALASSASADTRHLSGSFRADENAMISMDVVIRGGEPVAARHIEFTDLDYTCDGTGASGELSASLGRTLIFRSARGGFEFETEPAGTGLDDVIAGGLLGRSANKVKGGVVYFFEDSSGTTCQSIFDGRYVAR
jgi:hypothetical protein